jgi:hypothetical protein
MPPWRVHLLGGRSLDFGKASLGQAFGAGTSSPFASILRILPKTIVPSLAQIGLSGFT